MEITLTIFAGSFVGIVAMLGVKLYHLKVKRDLFFHNLCQKTDRVLKNRWEEFKNWFFIVEEKAEISLRRFFAVTVRRWLNNFFGSILKKYEQAANYYIKGRRELKNKGQASFFLKDIAEHKSRMNDRV
jgi:hypothetical protein